jgi:hypothetical protein
MERTLWLYWDSGPDAMPPLIRHIYEHNVKTCERFGWRVVLMTLANVSEHIFAPHGEEVPQRFRNMTPYEQSDFLRFRALRDHGGVWLDSDFIVYDNLDKLMALMDVEIEDGRFERPTVGAAPLPGGAEIGPRLALGEPLTPASFLAVREHIGGCKGSAILAAKKDSAITRALVVVVERKMAEKEAFTEWGEIGPKILHLIPEEIISKLRVINDEAAISSVNFASWLHNPGWNLDIWFKETPQEAAKAAQAIATYQIPSVGTWTMYRHRRPELSEGDLVRMVFDDDRSVFKALIGLTKV